MYQEILKELQGKKTVVEALVIETKGSTPRKVGSRMLVRADGSLFGTIGGGCGEADVITRSRLSLQDGKCREVTADLTEDILTESEGVCGGTFRVFIRPWQPTEKNENLMTHLAEQAEKETLFGVCVSHQENPEKTGAITTRTSGEGAEGDTGPSASTKGGGWLSTDEQGEWYWEHWKPTPRLVVVGAGHIAEPLETFGRMTGFHTTVIDDRKMFANRQRFSEAQDVICGPILDVVREIKLTPQTFMVLVTRGHTLDIDALKVVIDRQIPLAYLGMIGSLRRVRAVFELLEEEGYERSHFSHVHSPVGLDLGGETPAEIALAIVAEMVQVRNGGDGDTRPLVTKFEIHPSLRPIKRKTSRS